MKQDGTSMLRPENSFKSAFSTSLVEQTPVSFAFTSNRVPHWSDGCVRKHSQKETAKVQRKREKVAIANAQGREVPVGLWVVRGACSGRLPVRSRPARSWW